MADGSEACATYAPAKPIARAPWLSMAKPDAWAETGATSSGSASSARSARRVWAWVIEPPLFVALGAGWRSRSPEYRRLPHMGYLIFITATGRGLRPSPGSGRLPGARGRAGRAEGFRGSAGHR